MRSRTTIFRSAGTCTAPPSQGTRLTDSAAVAPQPQQHMHYALADYDRSAGICTRTTLQSGGISPAWRKRRESGPVRAAQVRARCARAMVGLRAGMDDTFALLSEENA